MHTPRPDGPTEGGPSVPPLDAFATTLLEVVDDGVLILDHHYRIVHANDSAANMFGTSREGLVGRSIHSLIPDRYHTAHHGHMEAFAASPEPTRRMSARSAVSACRADGSEFPVDISIAKWLAGGTTWFGALIRDRSLQEHARRREQLLADAGAALAVSLDLETTLRNILDLVAPDLADWAILDIVAPGAPAGSSLLRRVVCHHDPRWNQSLQQLGRVGTTWDSPFPSVDVLRTGVTLLVPDVTDAWLEGHSSGPEELALYQQLAIRQVAILPMTVRDQRIGVITLGLSSPDRTFDDARLADATSFTALASLSVANALLYHDASHATATRDRLLRIVSHDLRNPSSAIRMCATALLRRPEETETVRRATYQTIREAADTIHRLVSDLLDAASIDAGRFVVEPAVQDPTPILRGLHQAFAARAVAADIEFRVMLPPDLPALWVDRDRVTQGLGNLLDNALRFTPAGGTVTLSALVNHDAVTVSIRDTGTGIDPNDVPRLFDRDWHTTARPGGSGLGLPITLGIVAAHGGRIEVRSRLDHGSEFQVHFPLPQRARPA